MIIELLKEYLGFNDYEVQDWFKITETNHDYIIKATKWLDGSTFAGIRKLLAEHGGTYEKAPDTKYGIFTIPKPKPEQTPIREGSESVTPESINTVNSKENGDYSLGRSMKGKLGQLVPCLADVDGVVFDGLHRLRINSKAWTLKNPNVKTAVDRAVARMTVNFCRRHYTSDEMKEDIGLMLGAGFKIADIIEATGISESTIRRYMPEAMKDQTKSEAIKQGIQRVQQVSPETSFPKIQDTRKPSQEIYQTYMLGLRDCEKCGGKEERDKMNFINGLLVCRKCAGKDKVPVATPKIQEPPKPKETADFRVARMHPQVSKFEEMFEEAAAKKRLPYGLSHEPVCTEQSVPDKTYNLPNGILYVYFDGPVHQGREDRDETLRGKLRKRGAEVLDLPYEAPTKEAVAEALQKVEDTLHKLGWMLEEKKS